MIRYLIYFVSTTLFLLNTMILLQSIQLLATFIIGFVIWDTYLKPSIQRRVKKKIDPYIQQIFNRIDDEFLSAFIARSAQELDSWIKDIVVEEANLAQEDEIRTAVRIVKDDFDPVIAAKKYREKQDLLKSKDVQKPKLYTINGQKDTINGQGRENASEPEN